MTKHGHINSTDSSYVKLFIFNSLIGTDGINHLQIKKMKCKLVLSKNEKKYIIITQFKDERKIKIKP